MLLLGRIGQGCALSLSTSAKSLKQFRPGQAIFFRLDRSGFRPVHFSCSLRPAAHSRGTSVTSERPNDIHYTSHLRRTALRPLSQARYFATTPSVPPPVPPQKQPEEDGEEISESPYTIPNALTLARIIACPFLGYQIVQGDYVWATGLLFACGVSDWLDGYLARHWGGKSVLGSILDPAADKTLMTTLVITLAWAGLLPVPLAVLILGRDVGLSLSAFYFRYITLPPPITLSRYFDPSIPSAEVKPTQISKINTALQLVLMGVTTVSPLITYPIGGALEALQWVVAGTTIWSGLSYVRKAGFKIVPRRGKKVD